MRRDEGGRVCGGKTGEALIMMNAVLPEGTGDYVNGSIADSKTPTS